jgi:hypothetical protein
MHVDSETSVGAVLVGSEKDRVSVSVAIFRLCPRYGCVYVNVYDVVDVSICRVRRTWAVLCRYPDSKSIDVL